MRKNKSKQFLIAALAGLLLFTPAQTAHMQQVVYAAQVSDPHDSRLSAFDIAPGVLNPAFSPDVLEYTSTVDAGVTKVRVQAVPRSSSSVIASVEGRDGLQPGVNTIKVVCAAQDNTSTVYTITLTVGNTDAQTHSETQNEGSGAEPQQDTDGSDAQQDGGGKGGRQESDETDDGQSDAQTGSSAAASKLMGPVAADGTVSLNGAAYKLSGNFNYGSVTQDIPSGFGEGSVQIGGNSYPTLYCEANGVHLVYMENTDGKGSSGFYYYDEKQNAAERFKYAGIGDNFVVFISSARQEIPEGYQETLLTLSSGKEVAACQNLSSDELQDYYLIYGINSDGTDGWYLYDNSQGTYMRYVNAFAAQPQEEGEQEEAARMVSLTKYNSLNQKYTELKENRVKLVSIFVIVILLLIIVFTAILLRSQDDGEDDDGEQQARVKTKTKKTKTKKKAAAVSKSSLAAGRDFEGIAGKRAKKVTKNITQEPEKEPVQQMDRFRDEITPPDKVREQQKLSSQKAYEQKLKEQKDYEQKLSEQRAYEQKLSEQRAYEQKLSEQRAYEQKLKEQRAYEQNRKEQRDSFDGHEASVNLLKKSETAGADSVQLAAERMRQSMRFSRQIPKTEPVQQEPEHDPMDDWDMEETVSRKPQKSTRAAKKKRRLADDDMEIMDLNDL